MDMLLSHNTWIKRKIAKNILSSAILYSLMNKTIKFMYLRFQFCQIIYIILKYKIGIKIVSFFIIMGIYLSII